MNDQPEFKGNAYPLFTQIMNDNGLGEYTATLVKIIVHLNNTYAHMGYHILNVKPEETYADNVFSLIITRMPRQALMYFKIFVNNLPPEYKRVMIKAQSGTDKSKGGSNNTIMNEAMPIDNSFDIINPSSKARSDSSNTGETTYGNKTEYSNDSSSEEMSYYTKLRGIVQIVDDYWISPILCEHSVINYKY